MWLRYAHMGTRGVRGRRLPRFLADCFSVCEQTLDADVTSLQAICVGCSW